MGGSGVVISQKTLNELGPWLDHCLQYEILTHHEDVELGRCILNHVRIGCTKAGNAKTLFYHHYGSQYSFGQDFTPWAVSRALTIHPIKNSSTFAEIYAFYHRQKQKAYLQKNSSLRTRIRRQTSVTFLSGVEFNIAQDGLYQAVDVRWKWHIEQAVRSYVEGTQKWWYRHSYNWTVTTGKFVFGYYKAMLPYGLEVMIEVQLNAYQTSAKSGPPVIFGKQFRLSQSFLSKQQLNYREVVGIDTNKKHAQLNLVVVSWNKDDALIKFIGNFENEVLKHHSRRQHFTLTIFYFSKTNTTDNRIATRVHNLSTKYAPPIRLSTISEQNVTYNRGLGRALATKLFTNDQWLFFIDVDISFTGQALDNTRRLMIHQSSQSTCIAYFPVIFSFFSNIFLANSSSVTTVNDQTGLFSIYGFGNVVIRKRDLDRIGGWETNNLDWGAEDINLYQQFRDPSSGCSVFRAAEPGFKHIHHRKTCEGIMNKARKQTCHDADGLLLGSQKNMADYVLSNTIWDA